MGNRTDVYVKGTVFTCVLGKATGWLRRLLPGVSLLSRRLWTFPEWPCREVAEFSCFLCALKAVYHLLSAHGSPDCTDLRYCYPRLCGQL